MAGCEPTGSGTDDGDGTGRDITGRVIDGATGLPIASATVSVSGQTATTSAAGTYALADVPTGALEVSFAATGYADSVVGADADATVVDASLYVIGAGSVIGRVTGATGEAIGEAEVRVYGTSIAVATDGGGHYAMHGVPPGLVALVATAAGFSARTRNADLAAGAEVAVNFTLDRAPASQAISGTATDALTGEALPGVEIRVGGEVVAVTSVAGRFLIGDVAGTTVELAVAAAGYHSTKVGVELSGVNTVVTLALIPDTVAVPPTTPS
jgi:hypothetical protein